MKNDISPSPRQTASEPLSVLGSVADPDDRPVTYAELSEAFREVSDHALATQNERDRLRIVVEDLYSKGMLHDSIVAGLEAQLADFADAADALLDCLEKTGSVGGHVAKLAAALSRVRQP